MLQYLDKKDEWHTLDLMAVKEIIPCWGCMSIHLKDGSVIVAQYMESR